jgi:diguanylate cyclase (GGDEF)-like protein
LPIIGVMETLSAAPHRATWLCPDPAARERLLDMDERLQRPRAQTIGILGLAVASIVPAVGWWPLGLIAVAVLAFLLVDLVGRRLAAPEYAMAGSWAFVQAIIAAAIALSGGVESYATPFLIVLLITLPARFGMRGLLAGLGWTVALIVLVAVVVEPQNELPGAYGAIFLIAALAGVALLSTALMRSDLDHRTEAVVDGLTGLLNRRALAQRLEELAAQARMTGEPVAVVAADLDRFKGVNDEHGHAKGDAVLVEVAYRMRKELRAFDLVYRLGGEEFLVVLPGANVEEAARLAETLRAAIAREPLAGIPITMSFGIAGSGGGPLDAEAVVAAADGALYAAKAQGRDRVVTAGSPAARASLAG